MPLVSVVDVSKSYARRSGWSSHRQTVVDAVSLTIEAGETLGLVGESGSGKSTVARMILGLVRPDAGRVLVDGVDPARASAAQLRSLRRQMQPVFQDPFAALDPRQRVESILAEPFLIHDLRPSDGIEAAVVELLRQVGLDRSVLRRFPHEFSGGQRQRINIARALALRPRLLVLDEPVSALDVSVGAQVVNLLRELQRQHGLAYLFITHSMPLVRYLATRIAVMEQGRIVESGPAVALCDQPAHPYTQRLLASTPTF